MDTINDSELDLVIEGTGLSQSMLALALSRSGKKILHVDANDYYGGPNAALSLQDAEGWVKRCTDGRLTAVQGASIRISESSASGPAPGGLGFSRAYSLALSPQLIYSRSALLPTLVSSRVHSQLEFLAVGAWWIYDADAPSGAASEAQGTLKRIPGGREDVFADKTIDLKAKRSLMKFLKSVADADTLPGVLEAWGDRSVEDYLFECFGISHKLLATLHALTLSPQPPAQTKVSFALPRITRHLTSIGVFGPGFGAVIPKWGGLAEVAQVACRACAVGGGVYMLSRSIKDVPTRTENTEKPSQLSVLLDEDDTVQTAKLVRSISSPTSPRSQAQDGPPFTARMVTIVSSPTDQLFPALVEGSVPSAGTVVVFPVGSLQIAGEELPRPVYLTIHSSDTGECPPGQSVIYSSVALSAVQSGTEWLQLAVKTLVLSLDRPDDVQILWQLHYYHVFQDPQEIDDFQLDQAEGVITLPPVNNTDLAFDDSVLRHVRQAWQDISGEVDGFMQFPPREAELDEDDE